MNILLYKFTPSLAKKDLRWMPDSGRLTPTTKTLIIIVRSNKIGYGLEDAINPNEKWSKKIALGAERMCNGVKLDRLDPTTLIMIHQFW